MADLPVYDRVGKQVGVYPIDPAELAPRISKQLLHDVVVMYQANQRQGTFASKGRGEVAGAHKKMYRQKGTGNARAGSRRSGVRVGGGHIFAKKPRDFSYRLPKKAIQLATRMALASKILKSQVVVLDDLSFAAPKTKEMAQILKALNIAGQSTLVTTAAADANVYRSARNIPGVAVSPVSDLNAWIVLRPRKLLVTKAALDALKARVAQKTAAAS